MKRIYIMFTIIFIFIGIYIHILYFPKNYEVSYDIKDYSIVESYNKENKMYKIITYYNNKAFPITFSSKYNKTRKIVDNIKVVNNNKELCLSIHIKNEIFPICYNEDTLTDFRLLSIRDEFKSLEVSHSLEIVDSFNNTKIYNTLDKNIYIWNYKGYDYISKEGNRSINILDNDDYNNSLSFKTDRYLITPNYDNEYYFKSFYIIDNEKRELSSFDIENEISYSSYYLGEKNNSIYLVDKKHKIQYKMNIKKEIIEIVGTAKKPGINFVDNKLEKISLNKLSNKEYKITQPQKFKYELIDKKLYLLIDDFKILISSSNVNDIIYLNNDEVYYLVNNLLYVYTPTLGEVKLVENSEWNFNYKNKIYIFD